MHTHSHIDTHTHIQFLTHTHTYTHRHNHTHSHAYTHLHTFTPAHTAPHKCKDICNLASCSGRNNRLTEQPAGLLPLHYMAIWLHMLASSVSIKIWIYFYIYLLIYGCVGSSLLWELLSSCSGQAAHCSGFSCCRAWTLGWGASVIVACGLSSCRL